MDFVTKSFNNKVYSEHVPNAFITETTLQCIILSLAKWDTLDLQSFIDSPSESLLRVSFFTLIWAFLAAQEGGLGWHFGKPTGPGAKLKDNIYSTPSRTMQFDTPTEVTAFLLRIILPFLREENKSFPSSYEKLLNALESLEALESQPRKRTSRSSVSSAPSLPSKSCTPTESLKKKRKAPTNKNTTSPIKKPKPQRKKNKEEKGGKDKKKSSHESGNISSHIEELAKLISFLEGDFISQDLFERMRDDLLAKYN